VKLPSTTCGAFSRYIRLIFVHQACERKHSSNPLYWLTGRRTQHTHSPLLSAEYTPHWARSWPTAPIRSNPAWHPSSRLTQAGAQAHIRPDMHSACSRTAARGCTSATHARCRMQPATWARCQVPQTARNTCATFAEQHTRERRAPQRAGGASQPQAGEQAAAQVHEEEQLARNALHATQQPVSSAQCDGSCRAREPRSRSDAVRARRPARAAGAATAR